MNYDILRQFLTVGYFNQGTVTITSQNFVYDKGHQVKTPVQTRTMKLNKVLVPTSTKDLIDMGLGEYSANDTFTLYVGSQLRYNDASYLRVNDMVSYDGVDYKVISALNYKTHGFYQYVITKFKQDVLND